MSERKRLLFTIPNLDTAGSGMALYKLTTNLDKEKFEPHILCLHSKGALFQKFAESGCNMHVLEYTHPMRPMFSGLKHCWKVSRWLKAHKFELVYSYHYSSDYSEAIAAKLAGIKWIFVKKNMSWFGSSHRSWRLRSFLANSIIIQNKEMDKTFYPNSQKTKMISIGVDTNEFHKLDIPPTHILPFRKSKDTKIIGVVANFVPVKGLEILIDAFSRIYKKSNLKLILVGDNKNEYGDKLSKLIEKFEIPKDRIFFVGKQSNVNEWLNIFDIFVLPTLNEGRREGAPIAIQEAVSSGTLVIGSQICGIEDQLSTTPELLFEAGNSEALAKKIEFAFSLKDFEAARLREKQMNHLLENYTLTAEVKAVESHLGALLN